MRIRANDYEPKYIMKIIREWTGLTQKGFGRIMNVSEMTIQGYEHGKRRYTIDFLLEVARKHNLNITIEKD